MTTTDYIILENDSAQDLTSEIRNFIRQGYEPFGSLVVLDAVPDDRRTWYIQPMIKRSPQSSTPPVQ